MALNLVQIGQHENLINKQIHMARRHGNGANVDALMNDLIILRALRDEQKGKPTACQKDNDDPILFWGDSRFKVSWKDVHSAYTIDRRRKTFSMADSQEEV